MDAVRTALLGAFLAAGCTTTSTTETPVGSLVVRPQGPAPAPPAAPVQQASAEQVAAATPQVRVVALVGTDAVITDDEVLQQVRFRRGEFERLEGADRLAKEAALFREELRRLVERELVIGELTAKLKKNKPQMLDELKEKAAAEAVQQVKKFRKAIGGPSEADFELLLGSQRMTMKGMLRMHERGVLRDMYLGNYFQEKKREIGLNEVRRYYDDHPDEFAAEDRVQWLDLFVAAGRFATPEACRQAAADLARRAKGGADFAALVKEHGHGDSKLRGGEGVGAKRGEVRPAELEGAVFGLPAGGVSDPLPTETGFHVVKVVEREVAGRKPFDAATQAAVRNKLLGQYREAEGQKLIDELWRKTTVEFVGVPR